MGDIVGPILATGRRLVGATRTLKLAISVRNPAGESKSVIISACKRLAIVLRDTLAEEGVNVDIISGGKDLGVHLGGLGRRRL